MINDGQARILTEEPRDEKDNVVVTVKYDGSNTAVARIDGEIVPLIRSGWRADTSRWKQHHWFASWVYERQDIFLDILEDGECLCGEWMSLAHGTIYENVNDDNVWLVFDLIRHGDRVLWDEVLERLQSTNLKTVKTLHEGEPVAVSTIQTILKALSDKPTTSKYPIPKNKHEGAVWRVEREGRVDFLAKIVREGKKDGKYIPGLSSNNQEEPIWHWRPDG